MVSFWGYMSFLRTCDTEVKFVPSYVKGSFILYQVGLSKTCDSREVLTQPSLHFQNESYKGFFRSVGPRGRDP